MKDYFIRQFQYDRYTNQVILETIIKAGNPDKPVKLMAHLLAAQQIWLNRCKDLPAVNTVLWPDWQADTFADIIAQNNSNWISFLTALGDGDLQKSIKYKNSKGESFENKLVDILGHVINHGTHHRAQAGQHLILAGAEQLPPTDYIFYLRAMHLWQT
jgi:uncharacterized damage-inducible protein DinB